MKKVLIIFLISYLSALPSLAQVKVESSLSSVEMLVGQQVELSVSATTDKDANVVFPQEALLPHGIEVLGFVEVPDEQVDGGQVRHRRNDLF